jgi:hypothetical protein
MQILKEIILDMLKSIEEDLVRKIVVSAESSSDEADECTKLAARKLMRQYAIQKSCSDQDDV